MQVLCLSPAALGSDWVTLERSTVLFRDPANSGRRFIPLLLADCVLPDALRRYKHVDFREDAEAAFEELLKICRVEVREPLPPTGERHGNAAPCSAAASGMPEPLSEFRTRLLAAGGSVPELDEDTRQALLRHAPATVEALHVIEEQWDDVLFVHQLFQEYFAARAVAARPEPELARSPWRAAEMVPSLEDTLAALADSDPLPAAPATGWEETFALAAAMTPDPAGFVAALEAPNLPLAGRCAAQADVAVPPAQRQRLQQALIARSRDSETDLRARIAAGRALGDLGDPRFERRRGPDGEYLLPPLVPIEGGEYPLGSDEGLYENEAPAHTVILAPYAIGRFPVTNAEWQCFLEAGGYEDEPWWDTEAGRRWRRGEDTAEGPKRQWRDDRRFLQDNPDWIGKLLAEARITSKQAENYESYRTMADAEFEALLDSWYPPGRQTRPDLWDDPAYNHPAQPVVGISWHEARAYCAWLSAQTLIDLGGQAFRLPTEAEWEAAARGREGRRYPWGPEFDPARCNTFETHVRATTPLGVFPGGDSPEGVADLAGNVWEWTGSAYVPYPYRAADGRQNPENTEARRVVRGGSWDRYRDYARCAYRYDGTPGARGDSLGLRLVCVAPIA